MPEKDKKPKKKKDPSDFLLDLEKKMKKKEKGKKQIPPKKSLGKEFDFSFLFIFLLIMGVLGLLFFSPKEKEGTILNISYSQFIDGVNEEKITSVNIINRDKVVFNLDSQKYSSEIPYSDPNLISTLLEKGVDIVASTERDSVLKQVLISAIPWILIFLIFYFFIFRAARSGKGLGGGMSFGKIKAKMVTKETIKDRFSDVQGCDEAKEDLSEVVSFLKSPKKYIDIGAKIPKGVLLVGPPGNGKTLLAKAVAGESGVPFFFVSGSDFVEMFVGVGASRVRDLFDMARKNSPCIVFIDEIDAVGRTRGVGHGGGNDEREQTLNQMLVELDGFDSHEGMIVLAATNRADVLDKALLRPGRFDRQVFVDLPDVRGRKKILIVHARKVKLHKEVNMDRVARATPGFSGAELANLINEAALISARNNQTSISMDALDGARDKIIMGPERSSMLMDDKEKEMTAYHEVGHALVAILLKNTKQLHKISIIPRGRALGLTTFLPDDGKHSYSKSQLEEEMMVNFGGRAAEEVIYNEVSTGASNDINVATRVARSMIMQFGMGKLGMVSYENKKPYLMGDGGEENIYSQEFAKKIDQEVSDTLNAFYDKTVKLLKDNLDKLELLTQELIKKEILDVVEVYEVLGIKLPKSNKIV